MIDLKQLRETPDRFKQGARDKGIDVDVERLLELDANVRSLQQRTQEISALKNRLGHFISAQKLVAKKSGMGFLSKPILETLRDSGININEPHEQVLHELELAVNETRAEVQRVRESESKLKEDLNAYEAERHRLLLRVPQPPDDDVPKGASADENIQLRTWNPKWFDPAKSFADNKGFTPRTHLELVRDLNLVDFERGVKMAGTRHYVMTGDGMRLHQAVLRYAFDFITNNHGFTPMSVPVIVREECMTGTGFFPDGREQAYHIEESKRGSGHDLFLTGTGEVGLMGLHADEILEEGSLPRRYATVSTCFRREAGAAGKDTAGLYRIHQFDKVEQIVICRADEKESRSWHTTMIAIVEEFLKSLELPYRLLQCCTGDLGPKNADMIDIETWMPGRGEVDANGAPSGAYGETHSASRLYDFQCRRLSLRYKSSAGENVFCHSLNNTVCASPRILIPLLELYQNNDGSVTIPEALAPYVGKDKIGG